MPLSNYILFGSIMIILFILIYVFGIRKWRD